MNFDPRPWHLVAAPVLLANACSNEEAGDYSDYDNYGMDECSSWTDCPDGRDCQEGVCAVASTPTECEYASLVEVPLPDVESALDLAFADLDGDGDDELISVGEGGISVVLSDDALAFTPWPESTAPRSVTPLELQGDDLLDLAIVTDGGDIQLFAGTGDGNFSALVVHPTAGLASPLAIDPDADGIDQLVAVDVVAHTPIWFSDVLGGTSSSLDFAAETLAIVDPAGDDPLQLLVDRQCSPVLLDANDFSVVLDGWSSTAGTRCDWHFDTSMGLISVATAPDVAASRLRVFEYPPMSVDVTMLPDMSATTSALVRLEGASKPPLALGNGTALALLWDWRKGQTPCMQPLEGGADRLSAGDRDGDGRQELAVLHAGAIRLLRAP